MVASDDPRESIRRLIDWHCAVQIDPLVSSAAQELIARGRREALEQDTDCHAQGICQRTGYGIKQPEQEPDRWGAGYEAGYAAGMAEMKPEQAEPVAWLRREELADLQTCNYRQLGADSPRIWAPREADTPPPGQDLVPVFTHPPRREPLSDEELDRLWRQPMSADWEHREFARAVEAAHGIKEEK